MIIRQLENPHYAQEMKQTGFSSQPGRPKSDHEDTRVRFSTFVGAALLFVIVFVLIIAIATYIVKRPNPVPKITNTSKPKRPNPAPDVLRTTESPEEEEEPVDPTEDTSAVRRELTGDGATDTSEYIRSLIDKKTMPCDDFFKYACGSGTARKKMSDADLYSSIKSNIFQMITNESNNDGDDNPKMFARIQHFFNACVSAKHEHQPRDEVQDLINLLKSFDGWPMITKNWDGTKGNYNFKNESIDWQRMNADFSDRFREEVFVSLKFEIPKSNNEKRSLFITRPDHQSYNNFLNSDSLKNYKNYIIKTVKYLRYHADPSVSDEEIDISVTKMMEFERNLSNLAKMEDQGEVKSFPISEFQNKNLRSEKGVDFDYLALINIIDPGQWKESDLIYSRDYGPNGYFEQLELLISRTDLKTVTDYILWRLVMKFGHEANKELMTIASDYNKSLDPKITNRTDFCLNLIWNSEVLQFALTNTVHKEIAEQGIEEEDVGRMLKNMKVSFKTMIKTSIDNLVGNFKEIEDIMVSKLDEMAIRSLHPYWITDDLHYDVYYSELSFSKSSYFNNLVMLHEFQVEKYYSQYLRENYERGKIWTTSPLNTRSEYVYTDNSLTVPICSLGHFNYTKGQLQASKYATFGTVVARELVRALDIKGRNYDQNGVLLNTTWWNGPYTKEPGPDSEESGPFFQGEKCLRAKFENVSKIFNFPNPAYNTTDDLINNVALRVAYKAFKRDHREEYLPQMEDYSQDQMFFISYAQMFCSDVSSDKGLWYRAVGPLFHSEDFATAFNCTLGKKMNLEPANDKCVIW